MSPRWCGNISETLPNGKHVSAEDVAENVSFRITSRTAMIVGVLVILPLAGYIGNRWLDGIDKTAAATLEVVKELAASERDNRDSILDLRGDVKVVDQKNAEQDRRLDMVDRRLDTRP